MRASEEPSSSERADSLRTRAPNLLPLANESGPFQRLFAASPAPLLVLAPDAPRFTIIEVNEAYLSAVMRTREDLVGKGVFEAMPDNPDDPDATGVANLRASIERAIATRCPHRMATQKYDIPHPSGGFEERWWDPVNAPVLDEAGEVESIIHHVSDATERVRSEAMLRELNDTLEIQVAARTTELRRYHDIIEATADPIGAFDRDFRLTAFNQAHNDEFRRVNGIDAKIGDVFPDLFIPEQRPIMRALMARALTGESFTVVQRFGRQEFDAPSWEISYTPLRNDAGEVVGAFHQAKDISDQLKAKAQLELAQEALRQTQKMESMGLLTGGVAHDFNNLLTPIIGSLDMLQRQGVGGKREQRLIEGALQSGERAKTLVQRLLAFARRQPLQPAAVDIGELISSMAELIASTTGPQIKVVVEVAQDLPCAIADANQVEMAILNLAVNARDAMEGGGTLRISADLELIGAEHRSSLASGHYVRVSVADTGVGMDEPTLTRACEPFFSTKGIGRGTGLGLSMAHGLAKQLGGTLTIASRPGVGTNVEFWLPTSAASIEKAYALEVGVMNMAASGTVLLVDDEELVRMSAADMLGDLGYSVVEAASAEEALQLIDHGLSFDLLVTDHLMPGMTGTELAKKVQSKLPHVRVLLVSGYAEAEGVAPDLPRLVKPFRQADLAAKMARLSEL